MDGRGTAGILSVERILELMSHMRKALLFTSLLISCTFVLLGLSEGLIYVVLKKFIFPYFLCYKFNLKALKSI